ncbi:MAG: amino acid ABC transporter permease [Propionibacteriaceae bacterium]|jgi:polar amino acid transport system permease protein|nr:amino acid ABC transporter permease [Propionibacteriaceae bacterium]
MELAVFREYLPAYARAALATLGIAALGIVLATAVGLVTAVVQYAQVPVARRVAAVYVELSRNTPLVVQLFFLYYGLPKVGLVWGSGTCAVVGLGFLGGSYMAEAFRSGLDAVEPAQTQSALALGFGPALALRHVVAPQAVALATPAFTANVIFLIKETSVVSIVAYPDLVYVAKDYIGTDYNTAEALFLLVVFYLLIVLPVSLGAAALERRVRRAGFGA